VVIGNTDVTETVLNGDVQATQLHVAGTTDAHGYSVSGMTGVSCSGAPTSSFTVVNGIVTHC
jgi:hypothetical protein